MVFILASSEKLVRKGEEYAMMQMSLSDAGGINTGDNCPMEPGEDNDIDTECTTPCNYTSLQAPHATLLAARAESQQVTLTGNDTILSHYPDLLKRPPKV